LEYVKKTHMSVANELEYRLLKIRADCMAELGHVNAALEA
jgi:hypothetical protein